MALALGICFSAAVCFAKGLDLRGCDVSSLPEVTDAGAVFYDGQSSVPLLTCLKNHGATMIRLKLWNNPSNGYNNLSRVISVSTAAKALGLSVLLDFHYSDTWADPGTQTPPVAWQGKSYSELRTLIRNFTKDSLTAMTVAGVAPTIVQVGNEITNGFLWPRGQLYGGDNSWTQFTQLVKDASTAARLAAPKAKIMIHIDRGADNGASRWFYDHLQSYGVTYDMIGLSYYPWWHGSMANLQANVNDLATRYGKDIVLVETSYPWTLDLALRPWPHVKSDANGLLTDCPATPSGQRRFLLLLRRIIERIPDGRGRGIFYWEPAWVSAGSVPSGWDNLTLFDFNGQVLPGLDSLLSESPERVR